MNHIKITTEESVQMMLSKSSKKYKCIILIMFDAGLRITECLSLQIKHLDFSRNELKVRTLKKGKAKTGKEKIEFRYIPMTSRLLTALGDYWKQVKNKSNPETYIFPSNPKFKPKEPFLSRKVVNRRIKILSGGKVNPHMLRHSFATRVVDKTKDIKLAMTLLGHANIKTTQIYIHVAEDKKRYAIDLIEPKTKMQRIKDKLIPPEKKVFVKPVTKGLTKVHVGRKTEILELNRKIDMKVNVLIEGPQGIGKSHLLDNATADKVLRIDDFKGLTTTLKGMVLKLRVDKQNEVDLVLEVENDEQFNQILTKQSVKRLTELMMILTAKNEYSIFIDDVTKVTPSGVKLLEKLKNHFHIVACARQVKLSQASFLTNFDRIKLKELSRAESVKLIDLLSLDMRSQIEDYEAFKNHVWEQTEGNPLFMYEMVERYMKENEMITPYKAKSIKHTARHADVDFFPFLLLGFASLMIFRYAGSEMGDFAGAFRLFSGIGIFLMILFNPLARLMKKKNA